MMRPASIMQISFEGIGQLKRGDPDAIMFRVRQHMTAQAKQKVAHHATYRLWVLVMFRNCCLGAENAGLKLMESTPCLTGSHTAFVAMNRTVWVLTVC
jgi:hypothetical protein